MSKMIRLGLGLAAIILSIYACNLSNSAAEQNRAALAEAGSALGLVKTATNSAGPFNAVGQTITYSYVVTNNGTTALAGPVVVSDNKTTVACPDVTTVGDKNANLDPQESLTCTSSYNITQADLNAGSVTNNASASIGGVTSITVTATVNMSASKVLTITTVANPTTYSQVGQTITFTYTVKNTGPTPLGPAQFVVRDERLTDLINCDAATKILAPNETLSCSGSYAVTQNDLSAGSIVSRATASGGGAMTVEPATVTVNSLGAGGQSGNYTRGSTIPHKVVKGEWLLQISRCYGADFNAVWRANPGVVDPDFITPDETLSIPNIGSNGNIYGPPCVVPYTVVSGDTWNSIASKFNAAVDVLMEANKDKSLTAGVVLKIPINSAGFTATTPPPTNGGGGSTRIIFPSGSSSVTVSGSVIGQDSAIYLLSATAGQTLNVRVNAPANEVTMGIASPANVVLKPRDATLTWNGTLPANGDYVIQVAGVSGTNTKSFTMEVSLTSGSSTSPVVRVADINSGAGDSNPAYLAVLNGTLFFRADGNDGAGGELWRYNGTAIPARVEDINHIATGSEPAFLTAYNNNLYFQANGNDGAGIELWRYNGSAVGRLNDMYNGGDFNPSHMAVFNGTLYFSANGNDGTGVELWKTDGNTINRVADIYLGTNDSNPSYLTVFNGNLYFSALSNDGEGVELYKYDGTNPPVRVTDINAGVGNTSPAYLAVYNGALYFSANGNDGYGTELWKYDGTNPPTRVTDINTGAGDSIPSYMTVFNNNLYFSANGNDGTGYQLWKFDGTTPTRVTDLNKPGGITPAYLAVYNNELYFQANGGDSAGKELWKFKGP